MRPTEVPSVTRMASESMAVEAEADVHDEFIAPNAVMNVSITKTIFFIR